MPVYNYRCDKCETISEILKRDHSNSPVRCSECGSESLKKLITSSYMIKMDSYSSGSTCCGRTERCDTPPCSNGSSCCHNN